MKIAQILLGIATICFLFIYSGLRATEPVNYVTSDLSSLSQGWFLDGAQASGVAPAPPNFAGTALRISGIEDDAHLTLQSLDFPGGPATFSVYLRAAERTTVKIHLVTNLKAPRSDGSIARVTPEWKRFSVTASADRGGPMIVMVGGGESFSRGETIEVFGPLLEANGSVSPYVSSDLNKLSWLDREIEKLGLRAQQRLVLLLGLATAFCWILSFPKSRSRISEAAIRGRFWWSQVVSRRDSRFRTARAYVLISVGTILAVEVLSFVVAIFLATGSMPFEVATRTVWGRAWSDPATAWDPSGVIYSPLTQIRRPTVGLQSRPDNLAFPYIVNRLGLIDNEGAIAALDVMPEKPTGMIRINLYGGSTAMGIGARDGTETLTSQLERLLNRHAKPGTVFQVLNFGHGSSMTYSDLQFMISMGTYLAPDVSISLNGYNDAVLATESERSISSGTYLINWAGFSYHFNNAVNGLSAKPHVSIPFLPFSSLLISELMTDEKSSSAAAQTFYDTSPMRLITKWADEKYGSRSILLAQNLRFTAGYFIGRDEVLLSYLQPHPFQYRNLLTTSRPGYPTEKSQVDDSVLRISRLPPDEYQRQMIKTFTGYAEQYENLSKEYAPHSNIRFYDIRDVFQEFPLQSYQDIIHYTPAAQKYLAERMLRDLLEVDVIKRGMEVKK